MNHTKYKGFSLVELVVILGILGIVLIGVTKGLGENRHVTKQLESQSTQENIKAQLMKFALINKYLPCPDITIPPDGNEDRVAAFAGAACSGDTGAVPYLNIGLTRADVQDAYGNFIRYAVNQNADDPLVICDNTSSASYFCNATPGAAVFTLAATPPLAGGNRGAGNYFICNENIVNCAGTPAADHLESNSASVVLVAYNEDGAQTLAAGCAAAINGNHQLGANWENCDVDAFYHQQTITTDNNNFFDDTIVTISGYEIKSSILSPITVWNNTGVLNAPLAPTYQGYDLAQGDYAPLNDAANPDVISVNRNITTALNLGEGDDHVVVGNDLSSEIEYDNSTGTITSEGENADLDTGSGNDTVYIVNAAHSNVALGEGDDVFTLGTDLTKTLTAGLGNDHVWIQGNVNSGATLTLGEGNDILWLGHPEEYSSGHLDSDINGGSDYDILVLENMTKNDWDADLSFRLRVVDFELVIFNEQNGSRDFSEMP